MPTTVGQLFNQFGIEIRQTPWGENAIQKEKRHGIYIVSTSSNPDLHLGLSKDPLFDDSQINCWIKKLPDFRIDGKKATPDSLKTRLSEFWLPDESILYIGKATERSKGSGLGKRIQEYFKTEIGNKSHHSGGQWVKILKHLSSYTVYYGFSNDPAYIEYKMLTYFMDNVSDVSLEKLYDKNLPLPFANIQIDIDKRHGLEKQRKTKKKIVTT